MQILIFVSVAIFIVVGPYIINGRYARMDIGWNLSPLWEGRARIFQQPPIAPHNGSLMDGLHPNLSNIEDNYCDREKVSCEMK